ncbi:hypothetical protein LSG31_01900 [Fodinisporobacter ferrooxydans]|uniref:Uncharacterized protein n=1 Tax=Fodinisporobacter ferrooxydans TaxID=2901836 RepID=A0ABY4CNN0_9BACL|nr:hypothetical protein LSG31_01900 [Alicyclobacillaceae bacterium MYW30-H2]
MNKEVKESLIILLDNWEYMQMSDLESVEIDAYRFGDAYYNFLDQIRSWTKTMDNKPDLIDALQIPEVSEILEQIPGPLRLNLEIELDYMLSGIERIDAASYYG